MSESEFRIFIAELQYLDHKEGELKDAMHAQSEDTVFVTRSLAEDLRSHIKDMDAVAKQLREKLSLHTPTQERARNFVARDSFLCDRCEVGKGRVKCLECERSVCKDCLADPTHRRGICKDCASEGTSSEKK